MSPFSGSVLASFLFLFLYDFFLFASLVFLWEGGQGFVWAREKDCHWGGVVEELVLSDGEEYYFRRRIFGSGFWRNFCSGKNFFSVGNDVS